MSTIFSEEVLWRHAAPEKTQMYRFMQEVNQEKQLRLKTFRELHEYSTTQSSEFWSKAFRYMNFIHDGDYTQVVDESASIDSVPEWFRGIFLNFAENLLYSGPSSTKDGGRSTIGKEDSKIAISEITEAEGTTLHISWARLRTDVVQIANAMKANGVRRGDRIAVVSGNSYNTLKVFLGTTALGGIFSSSSPDMGVKAQVDRLLQIKPTMVFCDDAARYNGKFMDLRENIAQMVHGLDGIHEFKRVIMMPRSTDALLEVTSPKSMKLAEFLGALPDAKTVAAFKFQRVPFKAPFLIVYSSGTTGHPKCITHSVGGVLLASAIHNNLHLDQKPTDIVLQFTTTGWIMYLLQVVHMIHGARLVLYDGSPFYPDMTSYLHLISREKVTMLGTSPKWLGEMQKHGIYPREVADLSSLRVVASTGSVLPDLLFRWVYEKGFPPTVHLGNVSGGTDIAGAFACANPLDPVCVGGMQGPPLGVSVSVFEEQEGEGLEGRFAPPGVPGEMVVTKAFPNMPALFWGTDGQTQYFKSYFEKFKHVWTQGDNVVTHPATTRLNFVGRSDGVLNPAGIRFGSTEIYSVLDQSFPQIADSIVVGQRRPRDTDERVVLFLMMQPGQKYTPQLVQEIKQAILKALSPRHVPAFIFETPDIPRTINLKKAELPVKKILCGVNVQPSSTLANPECLDYFYQFVEIEKLARIDSKL